MSVGRVGVGWVGVREVGVQAAGHSPTRSHDDHVNGSDLLGFGWSGRS